MTSLVAVLSTGKGTWTEVFKLVSAEKWDSIFLITNQFGTEKFTSSEKVNFVVVDLNQPVNILSEQIRKELEGRISGLEVGLNLSSGTGREHMAVLSAILKLGLGIRMVCMNDTELVEL